MSCTELEQYLNIGRVKRPIVKCKTVSFNNTNSINTLENSIDIDNIVNPLRDKKYNNIYYFKRQKYFKEKIYYNCTVNTVLDELKNNNVEEITRIMFYNSCVVLQYFRRF